MRWRRLFGVIRKELTQLRRDPYTVVIYLVAPALELVVFGFLWNTSASHLPTVVFDASQTSDSRLFAAGFQNSGYFDIRLHASSRDDALHAIDDGSARVALVIPPDFGRQVLNGGPTTAQLVVDGSDPNVAQTALSAGAAVAQNESAAILAAVAERHGQDPGAGGIDLRPVVLYNPTLQSAPFIVPGFIGLFVPYQAMILIASAVVRERERGTLEQLIVTPITPLELMLGKLLPNALLAFVSMIVALAAAHIVFGLGVAGSLPLLLLLTFPFLLGSLGIGLLISVVSRTQPVADQLSQLFLLPAFFMSGVLIPREALPKVFQVAGNFIPQTYFVEIIRGVMLKGVGLSVLWRPALGLSIFAVAILAAAVLRFRKRMD